MTIRWDRMEPARQVAGRRKRGGEDVPQGPPRRPEILTEMEDAVAYLTVLGAGGTWGYGHDTGEIITDARGNEKRVIVFREFRPGVHHVDDETVESAKRHGSAMIVVTPEMPLVTVYRRDTPLTKAHLRLPASGEVMLRVPEVEEAEDGTTVVPLDVIVAYPCDYCERVFPHPGPRALHVERHHMDEVKREIAAQPEPPPDPEPALTDA